MNLLQSIILGIIQGIAEFIPVSSTGHLVIVPEILGWKEPLVSFYVILHMGTLIALFAYFWSDILKILSAWFKSIFKGGIKESVEARIGWLIILGTIPAVLAGLLFKDFFEALFSKTIYVAVLLLMTGVFLILSDKIGTKKFDMGGINIAKALLIGIAQAFAIAPGISRSGATIGTGILCGLKREDAARFAFLLSIPAILGAFVLKFKEAISLGMKSFINVPSISGGVIAAIVGFLSIKFLLKFLQKRGLTVFGLYCLAMGFATIAWWFIIK